MIPNLKEFDPYKIKWQGEAIKLIRRDYDYSLGPLELLLSGSIGSAKSLFMAHVAITHCLFNRGAELIVGRMAMPHLKQTILQLILDHLDDIPHSVNLTSGVITFKHNNSKVIPMSWQDQKFKKFRSYTPTAAIIEELTENPTSDAYKELRMRLGRRSDVKECFLIMATNPDSPSHWAYEDIIQKVGATRKVIYSKTSDNPFLPDTYVTTLRETMSEKECKRMIDGEWLDLVQEVIYYAYTKELNFRNYLYQIKTGLPLDLMFDFNIGAGKPMSAGCGQYDGSYHCFKDFVIHGARTADIVDEINESGVLKGINHIRIFGDASGRNKDTRSTASDFDIIKKGLSNSTTATIEMCVPLANPPLRERHNFANSQFKNGNGRANVFVYQDANVTDKGFRLSKLKKNGQYIEDDSDEWQHITTARAYWFHKIYKDRNIPDYSIGIQKRF